MPDKAVPGAIVSNKSGTPITDDHIKRLDSIMGTQVKTTSPTPLSTTQPSGNGRIASLLSSIPKPNDLSNKMFIFTGKKKIIIDGTEKEEEKIKTVNPEPIKKEDKIETSPPPPSKAPPPAEVPTVVINKEKKDEDTKTNKNTEVKPSTTPISMGAAQEGKGKDKETKSTTQSSGKKVPIVLLVIFGIIFFAAWALFWLVFFGYIKF